MIMKIHFRNGTGLAPPLCECCINNFCRVQLSAPRFSVWSSAKNGWIYQGEGCFWESRTKIDIAISHKIAESRDIRLGCLTRLGVPLVPHFFDCSMNMETSNLCGSQPYGSRLVLGYCRNSRFRLSENTQLPINCNSRHDCGSFSKRETGGFQICLVRVV